MSGPTDPAPGDRTTATGAARAVVQALLDAGVRHVVLCAGSRSAPFAYAFAAAEQAGALQVHVRIDERAAAFTALGLGRAGVGPAVVCTTSGTAVANLLPAVWEAHHSRVPLLALTADRPLALRRSWANQTTGLQAGAFGEAVRLVRDLGDGTPARDLADAVAQAVAAARGDGGDPPGPVHLNVALEDPLVPDDLSWRPRPDVAAPADPGPTASADGEVLLLRSGPPTLVVAGDGAGERAARLSADACLPLLPEPSAGVLGSPWAVRAHRFVVAETGWSGPVGRVVVVGRPTLSRPVARLLARPDVELVHVARPGEPGPARPHTRVAAVSVDGPLAGPGWGQRWQQAGERAAAAVDAVLDGWPTTTGWHVARTVARRHGLDARTLLVAASSVVRDLDAVLDPRVPGPPVLASRGLAGIDGTLSTAGGLSLGLGAPVRVLVGDLAFLHDGNGLLLGRGERRPDVQVVLVNDGGGGIFSTLEHGQERFGAVHERFFATRHDADAAALAAAMGAAHQRVADAHGLDAALAAGGAGVSVVEVPTGQDQRSLARAVGAAVTAALAGGPG